MDGRCEGTFALHVSSMTNAVHVVRHVRAVLASARFLNTQKFPAQHGFVRFASYESAYRSYDTHDTHVLTAVDNGQGQGCCRHAGCCEARNLRNTPPERGPRPVRRLLQQIPRNLVQGTAIHDTHTATSAPMSIADARQASPY